MTPNRSNPPAKVERPSLRRDARQPLVSRRVADQPTTRDGKNESRHVWVKDAGGRDSLQYRFTNPKTGREEEPIVEIVDDKGTVITTGTMRLRFKGSR